MGVGNLGFGRAGTAEELLRQKLSQYLPEEDASATKCLRAALSYERHGRATWTDRHKDDGVLRTDRVQDFMCEKRDALEKRGERLNGRAERKISENALDWVSANLCQEYLGVAFHRYRQAFALEIVAEGAVRKGIIMRGFEVRVMGNETYVAYLENETRLGLHPSRVVPQIEEIRAESADLGRRLAELRRTDRTEEVTVLSFEDNLAIPQELIDMRVEELLSAKGGC